MNARSAIRHSQARSASETLSRMCRAVGFKRCIYCCGDRALLKCQAVARRANPKPHGASTITK
eukprot:6177847-Pleurochrysis_carterae.AAC.5